MGSGVGGALGSCSEAFDASASSAGDVLGVVENVVVVVVGVIVVGGEDAGGNDGGSEGGGEGGISVLSEEKTGSFVGGGASGFSEAEGTVREPGADCWDLVPAAAASFSEEDPNGCCSGGDKGAGGEVASVLLPRCCASLAMNSSVGFVAPSVGAGAAGEPGAGEARVRSGAEGPLCSDSTESTVGAAAEPPAGAASGDGSLVAPSSVGGGPNRDCALLLEGTVSAEPAAGESLPAAGGGFSCASLGSSDAVFVPSSSKGVATNGGGLGFTGATTTGGCRSANSAA